MDKMDRTRPAEAFVKTFKWDYVAFG